MNFRGVDDLASVGEAWSFCGLGAYPWIRGFPKIGVPQNGWFITENPIKMDDLGVPPF